MKLKSLLYFTLAIILVSCTKESLYKENDMPSFRVVSLMKSAAWSNLIKLSNNHLLLFYQKAENLNIPNQIKVSIECIKSNNNGKDWTNPIKIYEIPYQQSSIGFNVYQTRNLSVGQLVSGRVVLAFTIQNYSIDLLGNPIYDGITPASFKVEGLYISFSDNNGSTFTSPIKQSTSAIIAPTPHHNIIQDQENKSLLSVYGPTNTNWTKSSSSIYKSSNNGIKYDFYSEIENRNSLPYGEASLLKTSKNIQAFVRTDSNFVIQYISYDNCRTWQRGLNVTEPFQIPAQPLLLKNNRILLFSGKRDFPYAIIGRISYDNGITFSKPKVIVSLTSPVSGYPNAVETENGILLTYYEMPMTQDYKSLWLGSNIYLLKFTEIEFGELE